MSTKRLLQLKSLCTQWAPKQHFPAWNGGMKLRTVIPGEPLFNPLKAQNLFGSRAEPRPNGELRALSRPLADCRRETGKKEMEVKRDWPASKNSGSDTTWLCSPLLSPGPLSPDPQCSWPSIALASYISVWNMRHYERTLQNWMLLVWYRSYSIKRY